MLSLYLQNNKADHKSWMSITTERDDQNETQLNRHPIVIYIVQALITSVTHQGEHVA